MKEMILYAWQFPQNIIGVIMLNLFKPKLRHILDNGVEIYYSSSKKGGVCWGKYVIVNIGHYRRDINESLKRDIVRHYALGKSKLSMSLGWFYLLFIGFSFMDKCADKIQNMK